VHKLQKFSNVLVRVGSEFYRGKFRHFISPPISSGSAVCSP